MTVGMSLSSARSAADLRAGTPKEKTSATERSLACGRQPRRHACQPPNPATAPSSSWCEGRPGRVAAELRRAAVRAVPARGRGRTWRHARRWRASTSTQRTRTLSRPIIKSAGNSIGARGAFSLRARGLRSQRAGRSRTSLAAARGSGGVPDPPERMESQERWIVLGKAIDGGLGHAQSVRGVGGYRRRAG
jgi:hypothetical protein